MTWEQISPVTLLERTGDAFVQHTMTDDTLAVAGPAGWAVLGPWRPTGHWGGGAMVAPGSPISAESDALAVLAALAAERAAVPEWFSTAPGRELTLPTGFTATGSGHWDFLWTAEPPATPVTAVTESAPAPPASARFEELDDRADAERIEAFGRAHNASFEGFPGRGLATLWLAMADDAGLLAVGGLHELASGAPHLAGIVVRTDARGQGLGTAITAELTRRAIAATGVATLGVYSTNATAIRVYERLGYRLAHHFHTRSLAPAPVIVAEHG
ncbi:MAG: GNAT family N-acetyltransferase [Actinomycetia bacterium]|nr:GNAT family N-acetyltransferase [Actinomycetes bacterium]